MKSNQCVSFQKASFLIAFILFNLSSFSQQFNWANTLTAKQLNIATNEITGDVYISGTFEDSLVMRSSASTTSVVATNSGFREAFVAKLDAFGGIDWFKTFGGTPSAISVNEMILDHSGAILLSGRFSDSTDFAPGLPVHTRTAFSSSDGYVLKLDSAGNFVWVTQVEAYAAATKFKGLVVDDSNNVYFSANFVNTYGIVMQSNNSFDLVTSKISIIKLNANGDYLLNKEINFQVFDFVIDNSNNLYYIYNERSFSDGETLFVNALIKLDSSLNQIWRINRVSFSDYHGKYVWGSKLIYDKATNHIFVIDHSDYNKVIEKFNLNGNSQWIREIEYHTENEHSIIFGGYVNNNGDLVVCGGFQKEINLKQNQSNFFLSNNSYYLQSFMAIYNSQGEVLWANKNTKQISGVYSYASSTVSNIPSKILTVGTFGGIVDFNPNYASFYDTATSATQFYIQSFDYCNISIMHDTIDTCSFDVSPTNSGLWKHNETYHEVFPGSSGCDSVVAYLANINVDTIYKVIRSCEPFYIPGKVNMKNSGKFYDYIIVPTGCDTVIEYNFIKYNKTSVKTITACYSYPSHDSSKIWTVSGTYYDTIPRDTICDLVEIINLTVVPEIDTSLSLTPFTVTSMNNPINFNFQWLDCDNNMTPIPNEKSNFYRITKNANVAVEISQKGCAKTSRCVQVTAPYFNSVEKYSANTENFTLYPNPTHNAITLSWGEHKEKITIRIRNAVGQELYQTTASGTSKNIEFNLPQGVYLVEIEEESAVVYVHKLLVR